MMGRYYAFPLRLGKKGRSNIRRVPYGLKRHKNDFFQWNNVSKF